MRRAGGDDDGGRDRSPAGAEPGRASIWVLDRSRRQYRDGTWTEDVKAVPPTVSVPK